MRNWFYVISIPFFKNAELIIPFFKKRNWTLSNFRFYIVAARRHDFALRLSLTCFLLSRVLLKHHEKICLKNLPNSKLKHTGLFGLKIIKKMFKYFSTTECFMSRRIHVYPLKHCSCKSKHAENDIKVWKGKFYKHYANVTQCLVLTDLQL